MVWYSVLLLVILFSKNSTNRMGDNVQMLSVFFLCELVIISRSANFLLASVSPLLCWFSTNSNRYYEWRFWWTISWNVKSLEYNECVNNRIFTHKHILIFVRSIINRFLWKKLNILLLVTLLLSYRMETPVWCWPPQEDRRQWRSCFCRKGQILKLSMR